MERNVCIHGHFYQPPRENPWLEAVEHQESARPYHDWNERITAECYGPNARSRILDSKGYIVKIQNNYSRMSFNVGPTLMKWLEDEAPQVYEAILQADRDSMARFSGHGSAIAQPYNHMIMPLANARDKHTQAVWSIRDFEHRFGRRPEGMWLPETAVDVESLDTLASLGITFTILEPGQVKRIRGPRSDDWSDITIEDIDTTRPYFVRLPSGRRITVFFYDGAISRAVAFEQLLSSGEGFVNQLAGRFSDGGQRPQIVHIATDGESYGHHHRFGDMALAYALDYFEREGAARVTNYGEYLSKYPGEWEAEILENTSWSCPHGIERWRSDCGCATGSHPEWNQRWRRPLREALDWLRDRASVLYEREGRALFKDPWEARNEYISVILDRDDENVAAFLARHAAARLDAAQLTQALNLLEMQRHAMLMFTSCGWFFDDLTGIETVQVLQYADRVIELAREFTGDVTEEPFLAMLSQAKSNVPELADGRDVYEKLARPAAVDLVKVGAHYAISSLFENYSQSTRIYCYNVDAADCDREVAGAAAIAVGRARITSAITRETDVVSFGALRYGNQNVGAGVSSLCDEESYNEMKPKVLEAFRCDDVPEATRLLQVYFGQPAHSLESLSKDERERVLDSMLAGAVAETEASYRQIFERHAPLIGYMSSIGHRVPDAFQAAAELVINANLRRTLERMPVEPVEVTADLDEARDWNVHVDAGNLASVIEKTIGRLAQEFAAEPESLAALQRLGTTVMAVKLLPFLVDLSEPQNHYWTVLQEHYPNYRDRAQAGDEAAHGWLDAFRALGFCLSMRLE